MAIAWLHVDVDPGISKPPGQVRLDVITEVMSLTNTGSDGHHQMKSDRQPRAVARSRQIMEAHKLRQMIRHHLLNLAQDGGPVKSLGSTGNCN